MPDRADRVADVAGQIEMLLQKWERKHFANSEQEFRHARTVLTAAVYELADTIVKGSQQWQRQHGHSKARKQR